ncbi:MAG: ABC transporter substrate-binding protein [Candidatus Binatia bacterium]
MDSSYAKIVGLFAVAFWFFPVGIHARQANPGLLKAKQDAEAKGYVFEASRDDIFAKAKKEGKLRVLSGLDRNSIKPVSEAFRKKYPFLDFHVEELTGTDANQRFLLELKAGRNSGWDASHLSVDSLNEYPPYLKKFDLFGMAQQGILNIPAQVINPVQRNVIAVGSNLQVVAYSKTAFAEEKLPNMWEGFLEPQFKGRKFLADIRPTEIAALVPAWGLEKTLDFARKVGAQQPVWVRGSTPLVRVAAGEYSVFIGPNFTSVMRFLKKDPAGGLAYKILQPVPTRLSDATAILATAAHPYAALLWLDFLSSPEGQKIIDENEPYGASVFTSGSTQEKVTRGKKLSVVNWEHFPKMPEYQAKVVEAYGFPKAEKTP